MVVKVIPELLFSFMNNVNDDYYGHFFSSFMFHYYQCIPVISVKIGNLPEIIYTAW